MIFDATLYYSLLASPGRTAGHASALTVEAFLQASSLLPPPPPPAPPPPMCITATASATTATTATAAAASSERGFAFLSMLKAKASSTAQGGTAGTAPQSSIRVTDHDPTAHPPPLPPPPAAKKEEMLPIDAYRDEILFRIDRDPVTIIFGETGCGKSSRLPIMLLRHAEETNRPCRMMVSQPRRIAVSSLYKRVKETLGEKVGMRMGHGVREECRDTQVYFVTTGYLVRLLAHNPDAMRNHTHIIIDEVHERSVDGDVVCLLVRRILAKFPHLKVILMSATIHTELYRTYFSVGEGGDDDWARGAVDPDKQACILDEPEPEREDIRAGDMRHCLFVGSRRFPLDIRYLETLDEYIQGRPHIGVAANRLMELCGARTSKQFIDDQRKLCVQLISQVASLGSSLLVFVSGMSDILDLTEKLGHASPNYHVFAIHSDIPFEEQEAAFLPTTSQEIKIILATNAAESSITLPDVDIVICLGMHKTITYDQQRHRSMLCNQWVSKASATQRAGRTGRVRPGRVFRLYTHDLFQDVMTEYGEPEILRVPLQETILNLRVMMESSVDFNGVVPLLADMLEPPDMRNVEQSFENLYSVGMIDDPSDEGALTTTGHFVGSLPVGIMLGRLVAYAVMLGVEEEGVMVAAALSLPQRPFRVASPLVHKDPAEYNAIVQRIFLAASTFDRGDYSEPLMLMNLLVAWRGLGGVGQKDRWAAKYGVVKSRMRYFDSAAKNLQQQVTRMLGSSTDNNAKSRASKYNQGQNLHKSSAAASTAASASASISTSAGAGVGNKASTTCSPEVINILRLILLWTNVDNNLLRMTRGAKIKTETPRQLTLLGDALLTPHQLESLFPSAAVPFNITNYNRNKCVVSMASSDFLAQQRSSNCLRDILLEMLTIAATNTHSLIPVVWVKAEELDENDDISPLSDAANVSKKKGKKVQGKRGGSKNNPYEGRPARVSYYIGLSSSLPENTFEEILTTVRENITSKIELIPCSQLRGEKKRSAKQREEGGGTPDTHFRVFRVELFGVPIASTPTELDTLLCSCLSTFQIKLSFSKKIVAINTNSQIPVAMLHQMFRHLTPGEDVQIKEAQSSPPSQCLDFLPEPEPEPEPQLELYSDGSTEPASGLGGQRADDQWGVREGGCGGLLEDVALGIRLYKAYLSGLNNGRG
jgi:HrpA-like RNA helicase